MVIPKRYPETRTMGTMGKFWVAGVGWGVPPPRP